MLKLSNGTVYDPANGVAGAVKDLYVDGGKIVPAPAPGVPCEELDLNGLVVMPGGVEIHSHVAGPKVTSGRILCPEDHHRDPVCRTAVCRSGTGHTIPSIHVTGYRYCALGYTTLFEAAAPPLKARHVHEELTDLPLLDKGCYILMGNNYFVMRAISKGEKELLREYVGWCLRAARGYAIKVVNPGGVENWKWGRGTVSLNTPVPPFDISPRQILTALAAVGEDLGLPHPLHLHCNDIGRPGNAETTLQTMSVLEGRRVHFAHLQFHSYGATPRGGFRSGAPAVAEYLNEHPEFTADVGQVMFGPATTMTADSPLQFRLHQLTGNKWGSCDVEMETGSGVVPMVYRRNALVNAVQWAVGLELFLLVNNPWQVFLTTDHPNGGPFTAYPRVIRLLMDPAYRRAVLEELDPRLRRVTCLAELDRAYTLEEVAVITSAGPARALGLKSKGHLGVGADADIVVYVPDEDKEAMFSRPKYVFKAGRLVVRDGEVIAEEYGRTFVASPPGEFPAAWRDEFQNYYSVSLVNYPVQDEYVPRPEVVPCA